MLYNQIMKSFFTPKNKEHGGALTGIVIIILILIAGGYYFYKLTKMQAAANKAAQEKAGTVQIITAPETSAPTIQTVPQ